MGYEVWFIKGKRGFCLDRKFNLFKVNFKMLVFFLLNLNIFIINIKVK